MRNQIAILLHGNSSKLQRESVAYKWSQVPSICPVLHHWKMLISLGSVTKATKESSDSPSIYLVCVCFVLERESMHSKRRQLQKALLPCTALFLSFLKCCTSEVGTGSPQIKKFTCALQYTQYYRWPLCSLDAISIPHSTGSLKSVSSYYQVAELEEAKRLFLF